MLRQKMVSVGSCDTGCEFEFCSHCKKLCVNPCATDKLSQTKKVWHLLQSGFDGLQVQVYTSAAAASSRN
jgi:hypothetical protein